MYAFVLAVLIDRALALAGVYTTIGAVLAYFTIATLVTVMVAVASMAM